MAPHEIGQTELCFHAMNLCQYIVVKMSNIAVDELYHLMKAERKPVDLTEKVAYGTKYSSCFSAYLKKRDLAALQIKSKHSLQSKTYRPVTLLPKAREHALRQ